MIACTYYCSIRNIYIVQYMRMHNVKFKHLCEYSFLQKKEELKARLPYSGHFYSDFPYLSSLSPVLLGSIAAEYAASACLPGRRVASST